MVKLNFDGEFTECGHLLLRLTSGPLSGERAPAGMLHSLGLHRRSHHGETSVRTLYLRCTAFKHRGAGKGRPLAWKPATLSGGTKLKWQPPPRAYTNCGVNAGPSLQPAGEVRPHRRLLPSPRHHCVGLPARRRRTEQHARQGLHVCDTTRPSLPRSSERQRCAPFKNCRCLGAGLSWRNCVATVGHRARRACWHVGRPRLQGRHGASRLDAITGSISRPGGRKEGRRIGPN